jgi:hypothetical protein
LEEKRVGGKIKKKPVRPSNGSNGKRGNSDFSVHTISFFSRISASEIIDAVGTESVKFPKSGESRSSPGEFFNEVSRDSPTASVDPGSGVCTGTRVFLCRIFKTVIDKLRLFGRSGRIRLN